MSFRIRPRRPMLQQLEERTVPSVTTTLSAGTLFIRGSNLSNNLVIAETATPGKFQVTNNGNFVGQFSFSNLNITMGNGSDTVDLQIKTALTGNLTVSLGNGADTFTTKNSTPGARIGGNTFINTGLGSKLGIAGKYDDLVELYNLRFQGQTTTVLGAAGSNAELLDISNATISGALQVTNIYQTSLGELFAPLTPVQVGSITVNNAQKNTDSRTDTFVGPGNDLFLFNNVTVLGNISYTGGNGQDSVELPGDPLTVIAPIIGGNVYVNTGEGIGTLSLGNGIVGAQIGGSVQFFGGADIDRFFLDSDAVVNGNVYVDLRDGDNQFFGNSVAATGAIFDPIFSAVVGGNLTLIAGNGNNFLATFAGGATTLTVAGNLRIQFGNGDNVGGAAAAPGTITFFNTAVSVGGTVRYQAGTGTNNLDITNETFSSLTLLFSGGPTTVDFNQTSGVFNGTLYIDFGTGFGPKSLGGSAAFGGNVTILNYP